MNSLDGHAGMNLAQRTRLAVFWNTGMTTLISIGQFCLMLVMVRLLNPEVYGQYGFLMAVIGFIYVFSAQNYVDYALQVRQETEVHYQDIFTISVGINFALFVLTNLIAIGVREIPDYSNTSTPLHWLSVGFLLQPGRSVRIAMLKRALDWKRIRILHGFGFILSACIAVPLAYGGAGIYALLAPTFVVPLPFLYDIFVRCAWRPDWTWDLGRLKPALAFGVNRQVSGLISAGRRLLESGVMVHSLGFAGFGIYGRAVGLSEIVCNRMLGHAVEALYPSLTKVEAGTPRFRRISGLVLQASAWFVIPIAALMAHLGALVVQIVYGQKWLEVIPLVGWAMALAAAGAVSFTLYKLLLAHEQLRHCLWADALSFAGTALSLFLLLSGGLVLYIQGMVVVQIFTACFSATLLMSKGGLDASAVARALGAPVLGTVCATLVFAGSSAASFEGPIEVIMAVAQTLLYVLVYAAVLRVAFPGSLRELISYMPRGSMLCRVFLLGQPSQEGGASRT